MKKESQYILPLLLICSLLLLASCLAPVPDTTNFIIQGRIMVPNSSTKDVTGWIPLPNATVTLTDSEGITHTVTTDSEGYYSFPDLSPGSNYIITATGQIGENTVIVKDIIPLVEEGENYNAGTADCESTALALAVEALLTAGLTPQEIDLTQIQNTDHFANLVSTVCLVLEEYGDVTTDPDVNSLVEEVVEEVIPSPSPNPSPPAVSNDATLSALVLGSGTLIPSFASGTINYTAQVDNSTTSITITPTASDSNATIKVNNVTVLSGSASSAINLNEGENTITTVVTAEDSITTKTYTLTVTREESTNIEDFWFEEDDDPAFDGYIDGDINSTLHTVSLSVPYGTDVTDLTAYFELFEDASATVGTEPQESGNTVNDFTLPITYTITGEDSATQDWEVTVSKTAPSTETEIEEYGFNQVDDPTLPYDVEGTIDSVNHTVSLTAPYGIRDSLIAAFVLSDGATAKLGVTSQVSGTTSNDFTSAVIYTVTAQDGTTTQDWTVTVDEEAVRYVCTFANGGSNLNNGSESTPWETIQYALDEAPDLCTIMVMDDGPYNESINPPSTSDPDGGRVIILKSASGSTVINGESGACTVGMFGCPEGTTMEGFIITHASGVYGTGVYVKEEFVSKNGSNVIINNCIISNNNSSGGAGGLWVGIGTNFVTLNDCIISNNTAHGDGGGIYLGSQNSSLTLNDCTISGNQATSGNGGGIEKGTGTLVINGGTISGNSASSNGGGIYTGAGGSSTINDVTISGNIAGNNGGGIYNNGGMLTIKECTISHNEAANNFSAGVCLTGLNYNTIGGSGADMNTICGNYITSYSPTLDDQIGDGSSSLYATYQSINSISASCSP